MAKYKVDITGINTSEIEVLSNEEMTKLFVEYRNGNLDAKERLINGNLKLVLSILRSFNKGNVNLDELSTYAVPLIIGEIKRYIRDNTAVRVSRSTKDLAYQIIKFKEKYISDYGVEPPALVISKELGIDEYLIGYAMDAMKDPASIFEPIYNDGGDTIYLFDQLADTKDKNSDKDMIISLRRALLKIKEREKDILLQRFMIGKTQMEIADEMGISQAQVSRLEKSAIINVRKLIK